MTTGRDPTAPPILVSGHLDSWDLGTGAVVALHHRIVWFGAEDVGLFEGLDYRARRDKEPHYASSKATLAQAAYGRSTAVDPEDLRQKVAAWTMLPVLSGGIEAEPKRPKPR